MSVFMPAKYQFWKKQYIEFCEDMTSIAEGKKMKAQNIKINSIPAIIWGDESDKLYIHVHGKMSCKEHAESFAEIEVDSS